MAFKFIDLFCGIGGFHLALSRLGGECVFASDVDTRGHALYNENFGLTPKGDIWKIPVAEIPAHDVLAGGFPCQTFSLAGKQTGFGTARGQLFFRIVDIAKVHRPKVIFLENVKNFAKHDDGRTLAKVESELTALNYEFSHQVINAAEFGAATARKRIYFVAWPKERPIAFTFPATTGVKNCVQQFLEPTGSRLNITNIPFNCDATSVAKLEKNFVLSGSPLRLGNKNDGTPTQGGQGNRVYSAKGVAITFASGGGGIGGKTGLYWINGAIRKLTPREAARIMGFPDTFKIHAKSSVAYHQIGNSVQVDVIQRIAANFVPLL
jgi:DNA (cytosine-5)-methyltransferase 1